MENNIIYFIYPIYKIYNLMKSLIQVQYMTLNILDKSMLTLSDQFSIKI